MASMTKDLSLDVGFRYVRPVIRYASVHLLTWLPVDYCLGLLPNLRDLPAARNGSDSQAGPSQVLGINHAAVGRGGDSKLRHSAQHEGERMIDHLQGFGFVNKWTDMLGLRVALGILEAGLYPSVVYLLATWYSRCMRPSYIYWHIVLLIKLSRRCRQTIQRVLHHRVSCKRIRRNPSLWFNANGWPCGQGRLALDLYHGGCRESSPVPIGSLCITDIESSPARRRSLHTSFW